MASMAKPGRPIRLDEIASDDSRHRAWAGLVSDANYVRINDVCGICPGGRRKGARAERSSIKPGASGNHQAPERETFRLAATATVKEGPDCCAMAACSNVLRAGDVSRSGACI